MVRFYEGIDGLKTGFTEKAGYCLTATGTRNNMRFISVVMGVDSSENRSKDTINLLTYGYNGYKINTIVKKEKSLGKVNIINGKSEYGTIILMNDATELRKNTENDVKYSYNIKLNKTIKAPIKYGDKIGELLLLDENQKVIKTFPLTIKENILKANLGDLYLKSIKQLLAGKKHFN